MRDSPYAVFFVLSGLLFLAADLGADVVARTTVGDQTLGKAITEHAYYAFVQPIGTAMLLAPFVLLGWMSASLAKRRGFARAFGVFLVGAVLLAIMYFIGYHDSQSYMQEHMWTAAALSVGLLPFKSVPLLLVCLVASWLIGRKKDEAKT